MLGKHIIRLGSNNFSCCKYLSTGPIQVYKNLVNRKVTIEDLHQLKALEQLEKLHYELLTYNEVMMNKRNTRFTNKTTDKPTGLSLMSNWLMSTKIKEIEEPIVSAPKSLYLWGGTGSGKTFLMDLFYDNLPILQKKRVHFHSFMINLHKKLHDLRSSLPTNHNENIIDSVVRDIINDSYIICFDEFQVTDIADAMLLKTLFTQFWAEGAVIVSTSNRPPNDLYKNGLQRELFIPFIKLIEEKAIIHSISESKTDYRVLKSEEQAKYSYIYPLSSQTYQIILNKFNTYRQLSLSSDTANAQALRKLEKYDMLLIKPLSLLIHGHQVFVPEVIMGRRVAKFSFYDLCHETLGAEDYIVIGKLFYVIFMTDIPDLTINNRDALRRFITCIDAFYEEGVRVYFTAASSPTEILKLTAEDRAASTHDEVFAFDRTISRLLEMKSSEYVSKVDSKRLQGLDYVEALTSNLFSLSITELRSMQANENNPVIAIAQKLWEYYYVPCQSTEYRDQAMLSLSVLDAAMRDILIIMKLKNPFLLQEVYYRYGIREVVNKNDIDVIIHEDIIGNIKGNFDLKPSNFIQHEAISHDVFDKVILDLFKV